MLNLQTNPMLADAIPAMSQQDLNIVKENLNVVANVYVSNDYTKFKYLNGNRNVSELHIERLRQSFINHHLFTPILVNNNYEIIDGQHRYEASKLLNLPIYFIIKNYGIIETQILNTNNKNWKKEDYLIGYCKMGKPEYIKFQQFMIDFPQFKIGAAERILTNEAKGSTSMNIYTNNKRGRSKPFESGHFVVKDLNYAYEIARKISDYKIYFNRYTDILFVSTLITVFKNKNYDHKKMINKLSIPNKYKLEPQATSQGYKELLEDIYNYKSHEKLSLKF